MGWSTDSPDAPRPGQSREPITKRVTKLKAIALAALFITAAVHSCMYTISNGVLSILTTPIYKADACGKGRNAGLLLALFEPGPFPAGGEYRSQD